MHKILIFKYNYLIYFSFFLLGFNKSYLYLPVLAILYLIKSSTLFSVKLRADFLILLALMLLSVFPLYSIGLNNLTTESPVKALAFWFVSIVLAGLVLQCQSRRVKYIAIMLYVSGIGLESVIISGYSFLTDPMLNGYGKVFDPFLGGDVNSPAISNNLSIFAFMLLYLIFFTQDYRVKLLSITFLALVLGAAVYLGGRTFFLILLTSFVLLVISDFRIKHLVAVAPYVVMLIFAVALLFVKVEEVQLYLEFTWSRFDNGLDSNRYNHYFDGLSKIIYHPVGGFEVDKSIENTKWYHNVFLDNARIAGWLPVLALTMASLFIGFKMYKYKPRDKYYKFCFVLFVTVLLVMQQDVVVEGNMRTLVLMYFSGLLVLSGRKWSDQYLSPTPIQYGSAMGIHCEQLSPEERATIMVMKNH